MKKMIFGLLFATSSIAYCQKMTSDKVPVPVMSAFNTKFPKAEKVKWEMEKSEYEASFELNKVEMSASYEGSGKWIETETEIKPSALPAIIQQVLSKDFAGFKVKEASQIENEKNGKCYEAEVEKGKETFDVLFSSDGKKLSQSKVEEKEKD